MADTKNPKPLPEGYDPEREKANKGYAAYENQQRSENEADAAIIPNAVRGVKDFVKKAAKEVFKTDSEAFEEYRQAKMKEREAKQQQPKPEPVKKRAGGSVSSASKRADGCAVKGKTKGRMV